MQHAAEFLFQHAFLVAGDGEGLFHDVGAMIADGARRQLDAVADNVVLERLDAEDFVLVRRVERQKFIHRQVRHRERIVGESIFFSSSFHSYIGKSTIQHSSKRSLATSPSSSPTLVRAGPANLTNVDGSPATKNTASPSFKPSCARKV